MAVKDNSKLNFSELEERIFVMENSKGNKGFRTKKFSQIINGNVDLPIAKLSLASKVDSILTLRFYFRGTSNNLGCCTLAIKDDSKILCSKIVMYSSSSLEYDLTTSLSGGAHNLKISIQLSDTNLPLYLDDVDVIILGAKHSIALV